MKKILLTLTAAMMLVLGMATSAQAAVLMKVSGMKEMSQVMSVNPGPMVKQQINNVNQRKGSAKNGTLVIKMKLNKQSPKMAKVMTPNHRIKNVKLVVKNRNGQVIRAYKLENVLVASVRPSRTADTVKLQYHKLHWMKKVGMQQQKPRRHHSW